MVDSEPASEQWEDIDFETSTTYNSNRWFQGVMGSCMQINAQGEGGPWSKEERGFHSNILELMAAKLGIITFTIKKGCKLTSHSDGHYGSLNIFSENGGGTHNYVSK